MYALHRSTSVVSSSISIPSIESHIPNSMVIKIVDSSQAIYTHKSEVPAREYLLELMESKMVERS